MASKKRPKAGTSRERDTTYWDPNRVSFDKGRPYVEQQLRKARLDPDAAIMTSRDPKAIKAKGLLKTLNSPPGFEKWQLPFSFFHPTNFYVTVGKPGSRVPSHSHDEGAGMRFILDGSITFNGKRLGPGDWVYIPKGMAYRFTVGRRGVTLLADYAC
ncbi:MAG: hypothetical protein ACM3PC_10830 [Deltaproteobacteria bacterium]